MSGAQYAFWVLLPLDCTDCSPSKEMSPKYSSTCTCEESEFIKAEADKVAKPDNKYRKDPERWLKGQHWLDEVIVEQAVKAKELPLGTDQQIEEAYRVECGGDPRLARFGSYFEMKKFILDTRDKRKVA